MGGCACANNWDGSVTTMLCSEHANNDPCLTVSAVTGKRRKGFVADDGHCTFCDWEVIV